MTNKASRWLVVALLAAAAACLGAAALGQPSASGPSAPQASSVFVVAGQVSNDTYGLYLVDTQNGTICVYQFLPDTRKLRLMAARTYIYDTQLDDYNTDPSPRNIKKDVEQHRRLGEAATQP